MIDRCIQCSRGLYLVNRCVQTKGVPIEALMVTFDNHWFWKRYAPVRVAPSLALQEHKEEKELELGEQVHT